MAATNWKRKQNIFCENNLWIGRFGIRENMSHIFFILLKCSIGLAGKAPFYGVAPLQDPNKYLNGYPFTSCYGARLGCKFHSI